VAEGADVELQVKVISGCLEETKFTEVQGNKAEICRNPNLFRRILEDVPQKQRVYRLAG
jgi:hypothetical protein